MTKKIVEIPIEQLQNHPKNVRKSYTDLDELAISIEAQGILQNLTVVPEPGHEEAQDSFYVLIGNRRLQAARKTSLKTLPCAVAEGLSEAEQVAIMVQENMQRKDLTPVEEAQGFQYMLDLGVPEDEIAKKTGISKATVKRRLELNKLDPELVAKRTGGDSGDFFQLSLTDLDRLARLPDVEDRNRILEFAKGSENLKYLVEENIKKAARKEYFGRVMAEVERLGIPEMTPSQQSLRWSASYETVASYNTYSAEKNHPILIPERNKEGWFYSICKDSTGIYKVDVYAKASKAKQKSPQELQRQQEAKDRKNLLKIGRGLAAKRKDFFKEIAAGKYTCKKGFDLVKASWLTLLGAGCWADAGTLAREYELTMEQVASMDIGTQMLGALVIGTERSEYSVANDGSFVRKNGETLQHLHQILQKFGFSTEDPDELALMDGSHPLYKDNRQKDNQQKDKKAV